MSWYWEGMSPSDVNGDGESTADDWAKPELNPYVSAPGLGLVASPQAFSNGSGA